MTSTATEHKSYVEDVLNAPGKLRRLWLEIQSGVDLPSARVEEFDCRLSLDDVLRASVTGEVVSKIVMKFLMEQPYSDLKSNGRSDYPDLYLGSLDYSGLAIFRRGSAGEVEYGAALKSKEKRPVRVPDGLEIKTSRDQIRVDCHHPHFGLHLVLVFQELERLFTVADLCVAFLRQADYHEAGRNTTATTPKYSFNGDHFISLFKK